MSRDIKELVKGILTGDINIKSLSKDEFNEVNAVMDLMKAKTITPEEQKQNREQAIKDNNKAIARKLKYSQPKKVKEEPKPSHLTVVKEEGDMEKKGQEIVNYSPNGQWKISKGEILEKPPVSEAQRKAMRAAAAGKSNLDIPKSVGKDFSESDPGGKLPEKVGKAETKVGKVTETMDQDVYEPRGKHDPVMESPKNLNKAIKPGPTLDYGKINPRQNTAVSPSAKQTADTSAAASEAAAPTIDYQSNPMQPPKRYAGAAERAKQVRAEIDRQANESAIETIARRQKMKKEEGTNEESEPTATEVDKMTAKAEEPHKDDPKHEAKEQEKAKKIKDKAQELLDMHKEECYKISDRGQWKID